MRADSIITILAEMYFTRAPADRRLPGPEFCCDIDCEVREREREREGGTESVSLTSVSTTTKGQLTTNKPDKTRRFLFRLEKF